MSDHDTIEQLKNIVGRSFYYKIEGDHCTELSFVSEDYLYYNVIRHHSPEEKQKVLELVATCENLQHLNLRWAKLYQMPESMGQLTKLKHLDLGSNYLGEVPEWIKNIDDLEHLNMGVNSLKEMPDWLSKFKNLRILMIHKNQIAALPESYAAFEKLEMLNCYMSHIKVIPEFVFDCIKLKTLTWGACGLKEVSPRLGNLKDLNYFSIIATKLTHLPDSFCDLESLIATRLHKNRIERLPENIGKLNGNLEQISLYQNSLRELPDSFAELHSMEQLNLSWNLFENFPSQVQALKGLKWLGYYYNEPCEMPPLEHVEYVLLERPLTSAGFTDPESYKRRKLGTKVAS